MNLTIKDIACKQIDCLIQMDLKRSESNLLPPTVRFDQINGSYDDNNKLKLKNL